MERQIFLVRVNPELWKFKGKEKDWEGIDEGDWVPFWAGHKYPEDIKQVKIRDIVIGYSCYEPKKCIESLGRIVSDGLFEYLDGKRFLIQKTTQLKTPIPRDLIKDILEDDPKLRVNHPTVTKVKPDDWNKIKEIILQHNPDVEEDIQKLENGSDEW